MSKSICLAQTISELKFILSETKKDLICVPLNLKVLLYCEINKIKYLNPKNYLDNLLKQFNTKFKDLPKIDLGINVM